MGRNAFRARGARPSKEKGVPQLRFPGEAVLAKSGGGFRGRVQVDGEVSTIFEKLDTGERWAKEDVELFPLTRLAKRAADSLRGVAEEVDHGHATKKPTLEENEIRVEMTDDGALDLRKFGAHFWNLSEVRKPRGIVAKQDCALRGTEVGEGAADFFDVPCEMHMPLVGLTFEQLTLEDRQRKERGRDADQNVVVEGERPEWFQGQRLAGTPEAFEAHAAGVRAEGLFAKFMIADHGMDTMAELRAKFGQALRRTLERGVVSEADEGRIAGVIAVGNDEVGVPRGVDESVEEMVVGKWITLPEKVAIESDEQTNARAGDGLVAVIDAGFFAGPGVMDVAKDVKFEVVAHVRGEVRAS